MKNLEILLNAGFAKNGTKRRFPRFCHITEKYRSSTHNECNKDLSLTRKVPVLFHNLENYDSQLIVQELERYNFKINVTSKTIK